MGRSPEKNPDPEAVELARRIGELGHLAHMSPDLAEVLQAIADRILTETGADLAGVALVDARTREVVHTCGRMRDGSLVPFGPRQPAGSGVVGRVIETGSTLVLDDVRMFPGYVDLVDGMRSEACVPLDLGGEVIGAINVESATPGKFGPQTVAFLEAIAAPVVLAVRNARLFQEERYRLQQLSVINKVSRILTSNREVNELLQATAHSIREQLDYSFVAVGLVDPDTSRVVLRAASTDLEIRLPLGHSQALGEGVIGQAAQSGKSVLIPDVREHDNYVSVHPDIRCEMCCPLRIGERVVGYLDAESTDPGAFDENDVMVFQTVADHIAQAVDNAQSRDRMDRLRRDLAAMVVHDLRNPLMVINSSLQMLRNGAEEIPSGGPRNEFLKYLAHAGHAADDMVSLLNNFLELEKLESKQVQLSRVPVEAAALLHEVVKKAAMVAEYRNVRLESLTIGDIPAARLDRALISRALENMVSNALKFTPEGGTVTVSVSRPDKVLCAERLKGDGAAVLFSVSDTGPGIPPDEQERIFDKFGVVQARLSGRHHAVGLGLAFCKHVAEAHGGAVWVESEPDKGSTFHFLAPAG